MKKTYTEPSVTTIELIGSECILGDSMEAEIPAGPLFN